MDFEEFGILVLGQIDIRVVDIRSQLRLVEDLGCDSLSVLEAVLITEELADNAPVGEELPTIETMEDLYGYYRHMVGGASDPSTEC